MHSGILPRRLDGRGGASVVAAMDAVEPKEIPMTKPKPKRQTTSRSDCSKSVGRNGAAQTIARKTTKFEVGKQSAVIQRQHSSARATRAFRKQAGPDYRNVASAERCDHRRDGRCIGLAAANLPKFDRICSVCFSENSNWNLNEPDLPSSCSPRLRLGSIVRILRGITICLPKLAARPVLE
jgi:hypothetical protein